jgi:pyruvate-formate lyase
MKLGAMAIHINVLDANILKKAQMKPEDYPTLQIRVCGWNAYFVNLSKKEQDDFIKRLKITMSEILKATIVDIKRFAVHDGDG